MKRMLAVGTLGAVIALAASAPAQGPGVQLRVGWNYAIAFPPNGPQPGAPPDAAGQFPGAAANKGIAVYRVVASVPDQNWYRIRMVTRAPQGGWITQPGAQDVWINLNYILWVQEITR